MLLSLSLSLALFHILSNFGCNHHHHYGFFCRILSPFIILSHFSSLQLPIFIYVLLVYNNNCCWNNAAPNSQNTHNTNGVTFKLFFFCILFICYVSILFPIFFTVIFTTPTPNKFFFCSRLYYQTLQYSHVSLCVSVVCMFDFQSGWVFFVIGSLYMITGFSQISRKTFTIFILLFSQLKNWIISLLLPFSHSLFIHLFCFQPFTKRIFWLTFFSFTVNVFVCLWVFFLFVCLFLSLFFFSFFFFFGQTAGYLDFLVFYLSLVFPDHHHHRHASIFINRPTNLQWPFP